MTDNIPFNWEIEPESDAEFRSRIIHFLEEDLAKAYVVTGLDLDQCASRHHLVRYGVVMQFGAVETGK